MAEDNDSRLSALWNWFRKSGLWQLLRRSTFIRSGFHLSFQLLESWQEPKNSSAEAANAFLRQNRDPWSYETSAEEQRRFRRQAALIDKARGGKRFGRGLEIGCAAGLFTEVLASRCESLLVLDFSTVALSRASQRRAWPESVQFNAFDLRIDDIPGKFNLIVIAGVLEYFTRPPMLARVRRKLVDALEPGGYLLLETTRHIAIVEDSWWAPLLVRGKWINLYVSQDSTLSVAEESIDEKFAISLLRRLK